MAGEQDSHRLLVAGGYPKEHHLIGGFDLGQLPRVRERERCAETSHG
jgi:hypothetical protein